MPAITERSLRRAILAFAVSVVLASAVVVAPSAGAHVHAKRKPKPCPAALTKIKPPKFAVAKPGPGTTTTTVPCRAVELDTRATYVGVLSWGLSQPVPAGTQLSDAFIDLALRDDGHGKLNGTLEGSQSQTLELSTCPSMTTTPGVARASVTGERTSKTMSLVAEGVRYSPPSVTPCPGGQPGIIGGLFIFPQTATALHSLKGNNAEYRYHHKETVPSGMYPFTIEYNVLVVRVKKS